VFRRDDAYRSAFPDSNANRAIDDIRSLERLGFSTELVGTWAANMPTVNRLQRAAINCQVKA